jgi:hypothetical protein
LVFFVDLERVGFFACVAVLDTDRSPSDEVDRVTPPSLVPPA